MKKNLNNIFACKYLCLFICLVCLPAHSANVINRGTSVASRVAPTGLYSQNCYDAYYGCMGQFCNPENSSGGTCACSDENETYLTQLENARKMREDAEKIKTVEVEKIQAGANADIIFTGTREYDEYGNVIQRTSTEEEKRQERANMLALWNTSDMFADPFATTSDNIADLTGDALYAESNGMCGELMTPECRLEIPLLSQMYSMQIRSDCAAFKNATDIELAAAKQEIADAELAVRDALRASFDAANEYNRGECLVNFKQCMQEPVACGKNWEECVFVSAGANMQISRPTNTRDYFNISTNTMTILDTKRNMCERVLDKCVAVRDTVWTDFLREAAPTIRVAELNKESQMRGSCLTDISNCIQRSCREDIANKGIDSMDACLSRPEMVQSFCKVELEPCQKMEPLIWGFVKDKLAAMRVDACTAEVKECFTSDDRCGADFSRCIGMDYNYIHDICPLDKLVVCKANNPDFAMSDLDSMLMGLYLNIDNSALETCQNLVDAKMEEVCGSTTDCNKFAADDTIGTGSLASQKIGGIYRISGMISFGQIKVGNGVDRVLDLEGNSKLLGAGQIDTREYFARLGELGVPDQYGDVVKNIYFELQNIEGTINRVVNMIEQDTEIGYCINGRNLSQITGRNETTSARFPNLLNAVKMQIATAALRQAQDNYNAKFNQIMADATSGASVDMANLMCNKLPSTNGTGLGLDASAFDASAVNVPNAIVLEISGVSNAAIAAGGSHSSSVIGGARTETYTGSAAGANASGGMNATMTDAAMQGANLAVKLATGGAKAIAGSIVTLNPTAAIIDASLKAVDLLASSSHKVEFDGGTKEMWSIFDRETRNCHYCTQVIAKDCETKGSRGFLGLWDSRGVRCDTSDPIETCHDIQM